MSKRSLVKAATLASALIIAGCAAPRKAERPVEWNTFLQSDARTNLNPEGVKLPLAVSWDKDLSDFKILRAFPKEQLASPAISNGTVYASSTNDKLYTIDLYSGKTLWKFDARHPLEASPVVSGESVCFGSSDGKMRCLGKDGKELWSFQARSEILSSPVISGDKLFFASSDDRFHALSVKTGEKVWAYGRTTYQSVSPRVYSSPVLSGTRLFHFFTDGWVVALDSETGKELWARKVVKSFEGSQRTRRTPLVNDGVVYVIDDNNAVVALSEEKGEVKGVYNVIKAYDFIVPDKRTLVMAGADQVVAMDRVTGALLWKKELKKSPLSTVFAAGDTLFVLSNYKTAFLGISYFEKTKGFIDAIRLKDGEKLWEEELGASVTANASSSEGRVVILTDEGILEVFAKR